MLTMHYRPPMILLLWVASCLLLLLSSRVGAFVVVVAVRTRSTLSFPSLRMAMPELPAEVKHYSHVPTLDPYFTATTIPPGLQKGHSTQGRVWGVIRVLQGKLDYILEASDDGDGVDSNSNMEPEVFVLTVDAPGIIEPRRKHRVQAKTDDVRFVVEFHRDPSVP